MSTRYVGTCPVCDARYKVRDGALVHHGYRRPGHGHIVGDCFAVHMEPHETSSRTAQSYREHAKAQVAELEAQRDHMLSVEELAYTYKVYGKTDPERVVIRTGDRSYYAGSYPVPGFEDLKKQLIGSLRQRIEWTQATVERMTQLVETWSEQPLTTLEEETLRLTREAQEAREARQAERQAAKGVKAARKAERDAKALEKLATLLERARAILDKADRSSVRAVREAYLCVIQIKMPISLQDRFFEMLGADPVLRDAGLFLPHSPNRLMRHEFQISELLKGR